MNNSRNSAAGASRKKKKFPDIGGGTGKYGHSRRTGWRSAWFHDQSERGTLGQRHTTYYLPVAVLCFAGVGMNKLSPRLRKLGAALDDLALDSEAMSLRQFDGLVAGVLVCPDLILPSEWLPLVWGGDGEGGATFNDLRHMREVTAMVMEHYNAVATTLQRGKGYAAIFDVDSRHDETLWEIWIEGFDAAISLRPRAWLEMIKSTDELIGKSVGIMMNLADIARGESELSQESIDRLTLEAPGLIPGLVEILNQWRLENHSDSVVPPQAAKAGRNDPCPCGSGKKYKKCCLN